MPLKLLQSSFSYLIFAFFILRAVTGHSQSLDPVIDQVLSTYNYGQDYCDQIDSLIAIAKSANHYEEVQELHGLKALCFDAPGEVDSINVYFKKALEGSGPRSLGLSKLIQSHIEVGRGESELAIQSLTEALALYDPTRDVELVIITTLAISWMHYGIFTYEPAIKYAEQGYQLSKDVNNKYGMIEALDILANCYGRIDETTQSPKSDSLFTEYIALAQTIDNPTVRYWAACAVGNSFEFKREHDSAFFYFNQAYQASLTLNDSLFQSEALLYLGENASRRSDYSSSIQFLNLIIEYPPQYHRSALDRRLYDHLSQAHASSNNFEGAYNFLRKYKEIDDEHWREETRATTLGFEARYQSLQKDKEIAEQYLRLSRSESRLNRVLAGSGILLFLTWFLYYRNRKNKVLSASKIENLEKQQRLLAMDYMVQGQEVERKRIAQDLHDGLGGLLSTARLQLQSVHKEIEKLGELNLLGKAEQMIDNACGEVRRIAHDMMPSALLDLGLIDAVGDLANEIESERGIKALITGENITIPLSDIQKVQLYRAIQEILNNAVKHSKGDLIELIFENTGSALQINISDNGVGFDFEKAKARDGLGLKNIESRIKYLKGSMEVETAKNQGTLYKIRLPIL